MKVKVTFDWVNRSHFEMTVKEGDNAEISIVKAEENSCMPLIWNSLEAICLSYLTNQLKQIGTEMKAE